MTGLRPRSGVAATLTVLVIAALLTAAPDHSHATPSRQEPPPVASGGSVAVRAGDHFPAKVDVTVLPNGDAQVSSPTLPKDAKSVKVTVEAKDASLASKDEFDTFTYFLSNLPKPGDQLMSCLLLHRFAMAVWNQEQVTAEVQADRDVEGLLFILSCIQAARIINSKSPSRAESAASPAARAGSKCAQQAAQLPVHVTRTSSGSTASIDGVAETAKKRPVKIRCRSVGSKVVYTVRARKKGKSLRSAVGKRLSFGVLSPADATVSVPLKVTFGRPKG